MEASQASNGDVAVETGGKYNASARARELIPTEIEVEDVTGEMKTFKVRRSGKALKEIIKATPPDDNTDADVNIDSLYKGVAAVLVSPEGTHPDPEWLEENLDFEVAQELMEKFVPKVRAVQEDGTPTSPLPGSTDESPSPEEHSTTT